jgi:repressor LexA
MSNIGNKETMARNLAYYLEQSKKTQKEVADYLGVPTSTFNAWMKAVKYPRIDKIEMLANYFGVLKSDLIEEQTEEMREQKKNNKVIANLVVRMQNDDAFFDAVKAIDSMEPDKLSSLLALLK